MAKAGAAVFSALGALVLTASLAAETVADFKVVVNSANPVTALPRDTVNRMFLRKKTTWPSGQTVVPVDQHTNSATRRAFSKAILGKEPLEIAAYWNQQIFSGRALPPPSKSTDKEVLAYVRDNPNAIGYVAADATIGEGVKIVAVTSGDLK
jgi:ABC-type phosphate transport system substrate-binding protein